MLIPGRGLTLRYSIFQFPACQILSNDLGSCIRSKPEMRPCRLFCNTDCSDVSERRPTFSVDQDWQKIRTKCIVDSQILKKDKVFGRHNYVGIRGCTEMVGKRVCYVLSIQQIGIFNDIVTQQRGICCDQPGVPVCVYALISPGLMAVNLPLRHSIEGRVGKRGGPCSTNCRTNYTASIWKMSRGQ